MSLSTNITLTVSNYNIKLSRNLKFYENDQLKLIFTLNYFGIDNANGVKQKIPMPLNALSAILFIETPLGVDSIESATVEENVVTFYLTSNQTRHIGVSRMQIQLSDADGCQITLPPMEFEVRKNIYDNEVILSQVLLADEDKNIVVDENGNAINTGTQVSSQTYPIALSNEDEIISVASQPTKQIKDFNLKTDVSGEEDLLIQDSDGVTKRIKAFEFLNVNVDLTLYYTKEEVNALLNNKADIVHTHTVADIEDMPDYALKTDIPTNTSDLINNSGFITIDEVPEVDLTGYATETYVTNKIAEASLGGEVDLSGYATKDELNTKANISHTHTVSEITNLVIPTVDVDKNYVDTQLATKANIEDIPVVPTKTSELTNDSGFITAIPTEYITESELDTELSTKANISDIPSLDGYATETFVTNKIAEASLGGGGEVDLSGYATKDELNSSLATKSDTTHNHDTVYAPIEHEHSQYLTSVPSEYVTDTELESKGYLTEHQDISNLATKAEVQTKADVNHIHSQYLTTIPTEYITETELADALSTKANTSDIPSLEGYATETYVTNKIAEASLSGGEVDLSGYATKDELTVGLAKKSNVEHIHSYNDLTNKPTIPSVEGLASTEYVDNAVSNITIDTSNLATKDELNTKANSVHTHISSDITGLSIVATSGDYNDLLKKPVIPTVDVNKEYVDAQLSTKANISDIPDLTGYALKTEIPSVPTNTSELVNDSGFLTSVPNEYITETELSAKGYLVSSDIVGKANISDLSSVATTGDYNDLLNKPNVTNGKDGENGATFTPNVDTDGNLSWTNDKELENPTTINIKGAKGDKGEQGEKGADGKDGQDGLTTSISLNGTVYSHVDGTITLPDYPTIPTKTSDLINDSEFLTSIPAEYITEAKLNEKGYLTEHQDISGKADKLYVDTELAKKSDKTHTHSYNNLTDKPTIPSIDNLATKEELTDGLATKANVSHTHDQYLTEQELSDYALKTEIPTVPTKTSQLTNDSGFINSIPSEYITETELNEKGYLTEHQDISGKANISDLSAVATSGDYNDLINTPTIPNEYILPIASVTTLGGIKVGSGLSIDTNGVLSATGTGGTGTGGTGTGNSIIFNNSYVGNCNSWLSNGYVKTNTSTLNLPALCTDGDKWGILFFIAENATNGTGTQMYFPVDGTYKGRVFTRSLTAMNMNGQASEWVLLTIQSDIPTLLSQLTNDSGFVVTSELSAVATSGNYNDLINKPTIPSIDGLATETYVNNKIIPRLVGNTVVDKTLTLTVDKYQYAVLSNGDSINLPSVSSFTEIHLFFKASADLTLTFPSVRWQSIPSITSGHTYEIIFTYVVDEWLAGVICYG